MPGGCTSFFYNSANKTFKNVIRTVWINYTRNEKRAICETEPNWPGDKTAHSGLDGRKNRLSEQMISSYGHQQ